MIFTLIHIIDEILSPYPYVSSNFETILNKDMVTELESEIVEQKRKRF